MEDNNKKQLYCRPCLIRREVLKTNIFPSYRTRKTFKNFHQLYCKSSYLIYLLQCPFDNSVGKSEASFNIRLNNHKKDNKNKSTILAYKHFQNSNYNFEKCAERTLIEQITGTFTITEQLWLPQILKLKTTYSNQMA